MNESTAASDEQQIHALLTKWRTALEARDLDTMFEDYADDALLYDACPPYKTEGRAGIRQVWEACLPYFPDEFKSEHSDLQVHVSGDVALVHGMHHFIPTPPEHPCGMTWMRITIGFKRIEGHWKVIHEHCSIPFNPMTNEAWSIKDPNNLEAPDYSSAKTNS